MKIRRKTKKGFTLVELVVVIAVIAVLAAVSVGAYFGITDSANSSAAEQYKKQIKDLWIMYSVSQEYVNGTTDDEIRQNAEHFCLTYARDNGPQNVVVNYRLIDVIPTGSVSSLKDATYTHTGIIFLIDSDYDTYFVTCGQRIIAESSLLKSEEDFKNLMTTEETLFMSNQDRLIFNVSGYGAFELTNIGGDNENLMGYQYYQVNISGDKVDTIYVRTNSTIANSSEYAIQSVKVQEGEGNSPSIAGRPYILNYLKSGSEVDPSIAIPESEIEKCEPQLVEGKKYDYVVGTVEVNYTAWLIDSSINLFNYPVCDFVSHEEVIFFRNINEAKNFIENNQNDGKTHYLFLGNTSFDVDITIPENYNVVIDSSISIQEDITTQENVNSMEIFASYNYDENYTLPTKNNNRTVNNSKTVKYESITEFSGNQVTINSKIDLKGKLFNDGIFHVASGGTSGVRVTDASKIILNQNGEIKLNGEKSVLRSIGNIEGEGKIITTPLSTVIEPFKITAFAGGTNTALLYTNKIFPFFDYKLDSISSDVIFVKDAKYISFLGLTVQGGDRDMAPINLIGPNNSLFSPMNDTSYLIKSYSIEQKRTIISMFGQIIDANISISIKLPVVGVQAMESCEFNFPISNMNIIVNENSELNLQASKGRKYAHYEIYPNSSIINYGKIIINSNNSISLLNKKDYSDINASGFEWVALLLDIFEANSENKILYNYNGGTIDGKIYAMTNEAGLKDEQNQTIYYGFNLTSNKNKSHKIKFVTGIGSFFGVPYPQTNDKDVYEIVFVD